MIRCAAAILVLLMAPAAAAQTLIIQHDNDEWGGKQTDWEYSQGTRVTWLSPKLAETGIAQTVALMLPGLDFDATLAAGLGGGSAYYEPRSFALATPIPDQRPYAGYLYGSALINAEGDSQLTSWRLDMGLVGPAARGEETTQLFHNAFNGYAQQGWDNQITNRFTANVSLERRWRNLIPLGQSIAADISPAIGLEFGNVATSANAGLTLRLGLGLDADFGPPRLGVFSGASSGRSDATSIYIFATANGAYVPYDVFLDEAGGREGDSVRAGQSITRDFFRSQTSFGIVGAYGRLRATLAITDASATYDQQFDAERYSELSLAFRF
jgi:lipid A 3-O-deacylase